MPWLAGGEQQWTEFPEFFDGREFWHVAENYGQTVDGETETVYSEGYFLAALGRRPAVAPLFLFRQQNECQWP